RKGLPAETIEDFLVTPVGQLRIGNGDFSNEPTQYRLLGGAVGGFKAEAEYFINRAVDAADEEAGDTSHVAKIGSACAAFFETRDIGFRHPFIGRQREQERYVYVDPFADQLLDCRNTLVRGRNLDHHIVASNGLPQPPRFLDRAFSIASEKRRNLQAD